MNGDYETYEAGEVADLVVFSGISIMIYRHDPGNKISNSDWDLRQLRGPAEFDALVLDPTAQVPLFPDERQDYVTYVVLQRRETNDFIEGWVLSVHLSKRK